MLPFSLLYLLLHLILVILGCSTGPSVEGSKYVRCIKREKLALIDIKKSFTSAYLGDSELLYWNSAEGDCCAWYGITCNNHTGHVISLDLSFEFLISYQLLPSLLELQHLRRLDFSWNDFTMRIPEFIGSLSKLTYLDLSHAGFLSKIPPHLGNISGLRTLVLINQDRSLYSENFRWLSHLSSLERLDVSYVDFSGARDWLSAIGMLSLLSSFNCSSCYLPTPATSDYHVNSSTSFKMIDLSYNILSSSISSWLIYNSRNLLEPCLSYMNTNDPFSDLFQNMVSLRTLQLPRIHLEQGALESIGNLCNLKELVVSKCGMNQSLPHVLQTMKSCASSSFKLRRVVPVVHWKP